MLNLFGKGKAREYNNYYCNSYYYYYGAGYLYCNRIEFLSNEICSFHRHSLFKFRLVL